MDKEIEKIKIQEAIKEISKVACKLGVTSEEVLESIKLFRKSINKKLTKQ